MNERIRVLVVDDSGLLRHKLSPDFEVVGSTGDAETARSLAGEHYPDVVVMALDGPYEPVGVVRAIVRSVPTTKIVVVGTGDDDVVFEAVKAGAVCHLPASAPPDEVTAAVRTVHDDGCLVGPEVAARMIEEFAAVARRPDRKAPMPHLTGRELEVLELTVGRETNEEIARRLSITDNTVRNHQRNVLAKLHFGARL